MSWPALPDPHAIAVLALLVVAFVLFTRDRIPIAATSLFVLVTLAVGFHLLPYTGASGATLESTEFFSGFGHEALVAILALMVLGKSLESTGALTPVVRSLERLWAMNAMLSLLAVLVACMVLSAFLNNTPIVVMAMPILVGIALRTKSSPAATLMPMNFATIVGGMCTTIGTSTNLLVAGVATDLGMRRLSVFDITPPAAMVAAAALVFLWLVAPRLLPERRAPISDRSQRVFEAALHVTASSKALGKTIAEAISLSGGRLKIRAIVRGDLELIRLPTLVLQENDQIRVADTAENLKEFESTLGAPLHNLDEAHTRVKETDSLDLRGQQLAEVVVTENSPLAGSTLRRTRFAEGYGVYVLALHRTISQRSVVNRAELGGRQLSPGDVLLVQGTRDQIKALKAEGFLVLDERMELPHSKKAPVALAIMAAVVVAAASGWLPIALSALVGAALMLATRCLDWRDVARSLSLQIVMIVAASLALGVALTRTGGADYMAQLFVAGVFGAPPVVALSGLMLVMALLTNVVSNNAAAVVGTPIAVRIAQELGAPMEPFVLAVMFGANLSFATPMGYQTNLLVMNAAGYKFTDFLRVGLPLAIIMWLGFSITLPMFYPLG